MLLFTFFSQLQILNWNLCYGMVNIIYYWASNILIIFSFCLTMFPGLHNKDFFCSLLLRVSILSCRLSIQFSANLSSCFLEPPTFLLWSDWRSLQAWESAQVPEPPSSCLTFLSPHLLDPCFSALLNLNPLRQSMFSRSLLRKEWKRNFPKSLPVWKCLCCPAEHKF